MEPVQTSLMRVLTRPSKFVDRDVTILGLSYTTTLKVMRKPKAVLLYHYRHKNYDTLVLRNMCCVSL